MVYKNGTVLQTTKGQMIVQCPFTFKQNNLKKYSAVGGMTLYWLHDELGNDVFYWDYDLKKLKLKEKI